MPPLAKEPELRRCAAP